VLINDAVSTADVILRQIRWKGYGSLCVMIGK